MGLCTEMKSIFLLQNISSSTRHTTPTIQSCGPFTQTLTEIYAKQTICMALRVVTAGTRYDITRSVVRLSHIGDGTIISE